MMHNDMNLQMISAREGKISLFQWKVTDYPNHTEGQAVPLFLGVIGHDKTNSKIFCEILMSHLVISFFRLF